VVKMEIFGDDAVALEAAPEDGPRVRSVPGARWDAEHSVWLLPLSWATCVVARGVFGDELEVGPELTAWALEEHRNRIDPVNDARQATDGPPVEASAVEAEGSWAEQMNDPQPAGPPDFSKAWWWEIWQGMPEFLNRDLSPWKTLKVHFRNPADLEAFGKMIGQRITPSTRSIWVPETDVVHEVDWRYADASEPIAQDDPTVLPRRRGSKREHQNKKTGDKSLDALLGMIQ
jgi:hypothetical protein